MVQIATLLLAASASLSVALPSANVEKSNALFARGPPNLDEEFTLQKTKNNPDTGDFTQDGGDVTLNVGDKLGEGSAGIIYAIKCNDHPGCSDLGKVVLKYYKQNGQAEPEQRHLSKIDELKAVGNRDGQDFFTILTAWDGYNLEKLPKYVELIADKDNNKDAINKLVDSAIEKIRDDLSYYIREHHIFHDDVAEGNVLLVEAEGLITTAKLIDWDAATIFDADQVEDALGDVEKVVNDGFGRFRIE